MEEEDTYDPYASMGMLGKTNKKGDRLDFGMQSSQIEREEAENQDMERDEMDSGEEVEQEGSEEMMALGSSSHTGRHRADATEEDDLLQEEKIDEEDSQREDHKSQESNHSRDDEEDGGSYFDNSMYQKFSSSYKFSMNDLQELKKAG